MERPIRTLIRTWRRRIQECCRGDLRARRHDAGARGALFDTASIAARQEGSEHARSDLIIVSNPPWGKNIGTAEDGEPIVRSLVTQFCGTTMVLLVNKQTRMALEKMADAPKDAPCGVDIEASAEGTQAKALMPQRVPLEVLKVIKLGVEVVLLSTTDREGARLDSVSGFTYRYVSHHIIPGRLLTCAL